MSKLIPRNMLYSFVIGAMALTGALAADKSDSKRTEAVDKLSFAVEEIEIVQRAFDEGKQDQLKKQFKRAKSYFMGGLSGIRKTDRSLKTNEITETYEDRLETLIGDKKELDAETVDGIAELFQEAHDYFNQADGD